VKRSGSKAVGRDAIFREDQMECFSAVRNNITLKPQVLSGTSTVKHIGIVLFNGFALPETASILEVFQSANALSHAGRNGAIRYDVCLLSASGGRIAASSSVFVWTESIGARRHADNFHALFIAGGTGAGNALRDERLTAWLRRACPRSDLVFPIAEGRLLLEAAGCAQPVEGARSSEDARPAKWKKPADNRSATPASPLQIALRVVEEDLGAEIARQVADRVEPSEETPFTAGVRESSSVRVSEKIQASARWLEANGDRNIAIDDAAQVVAMSERNFLRRFKVEMGLTPSDYLLSVRLDMSCRLLLETDLPVDKIARRCGIGSGGQLAKLFRKHLATTPTEYRSCARTLRNG
jgi:transcriptional regulator GlxA family with amidase domain